MLIAVRITKSRLCATAIAVVLLSGCSDTEDSIGDRPLSPVPSGDLICEMIPKGTVSTMFGAIKYEVSPGGGRHSVQDELDFADCKLQKPGKPAELYLSAHMTIGIDNSIAKDERVKSAGKPVADLGAGFVDQSSGGRAWAGVVRANRSYMVEIFEVSEKRDPKADAVAVLHQLVAVLDPVQ